MRYTLEYTELLRQGELPQVADNSTYEHTGVWFDGDDEYEVKHSFTADNEEAAKSYARTFSNDWNVGVFSVFSGDEIVFTEEQL